LLIAIAAVASLTAPLSNTGLRSLFPLIIPVHLWERVNAVDSTGYVVATIIGPPLAAFMVAIWGPAAFIVIGLSFGLAAIVLIGAPDPPTQGALSGSLIRDAWQGLIYTNNRTLRGLGFYISVLNLNSGIHDCGSLVVLERLRLGTTVVGLVLAMQGGRRCVGVSLWTDGRTRGRADDAGGVRAAASVRGVAAGELGPGCRGIVMARPGFSTRRRYALLGQRRTEKSWTGRAFAVSMSFNALGIPIGSAVAGVVAARSIEGAVLFGVVAAVAAGILAAAMIE
jgi:hypothetical protein